MPRANVKSDELLPDGGIPPDEAEKRDAEPVSDPTATQAAIRKELVEDFLDDPEIVAETLQADVLLEDAEHDEDLVKSVVNAQIDDFFEG